MLTHEIGYKVSVVPWANGEPLAASTDKNAVVDILSNHDTTVCDLPGSVPCFRPVGLAWDSQGRLFVSSDQTGEIYAIMRDDGTSVMNTNPSPGSGTGSKSAASLVRASSISTLGVILVVFALMI